MADGFLELLKPLPDKKFNHERIKNYSSTNRFSLPTWGVIVDEKG
jgi:hypothetical protein